MTHSNDNGKSFMKGYRVLFKKKTMVQKEQKLIERWHRPSPISKVGHVNPNELHAQTLKIDIIHLVS